VVPDVRPVIRRVVAVVPVEIVVGDDMFDEVE
jgi:hypothetical protein